MKPCSKVIDSVGAAKWIKQAERQARSIKGRSGVSRKIIDGYDVKGSSSSGHLRASVIDLPGKMAFFGRVPRSHSTGVEVAETSLAPVRRIMLDQPTQDESGTLFIGEVSEGLDDIEYIGGPPPSGPLYFLGATPPVPTRSGPIQSNLVTSGNPSITTYVEHENDTYTTWIDYSGVSGVWALVRLSLCGRAGRDLLINEQMILSLFGARIIQRRKIYGVYDSTGRVIATMHDNKIMMAVLLREVEDERSDPTSIGFLVLRRVDGSWSVDSSSKISYDEYPHPLFQPHESVELGLDSGTGGNPMSPPGITGVSLASYTIATDGDSIWFNSILSHEVPALARDPQRAGSVLAWRSLSVSGLLRCHVDVATGSVTSSISMVNCDAAMGSPTEGLTFPETLQTTEAGLVSDYIESPWPNAEWAYYCGLAYDGAELIDVVGVVLGDRSSSFNGSSRWRGNHTYANPCSRVIVNGTPADTDDWAFSAQLPGNNYIGFRLMGGSSEMLEPDYLNWWPVTAIGGGDVEMPMFEPQSSNQRVVRIGGGVFYEVPAPSGARNPTSSCFSVAEFGDDDEMIRPHRSIVSFEEGDGYTIQLRSGDDIVATVSGISAKMGMGAYYSGNPLAQMVYGRF